MCQVGGEAFVMAYHNWRNDTAKPKSDQTLYVFKMSSYNFQLVKIFFPQSYFQDLDHTYLPLETGSIAVYPKEPLNLLKKSDRNSAFQILWTLSQSIKNNVTPAYPAKPPPASPTIEHPRTH
eukprot:TRINITY_DN5561_c0_g1_i1.p1 TRINITY_DN5561_c0_g1~~TRINITY_DN5561_c0_g1_i1.p1  ORF type:complete len:122 (-),score=25.94 TRINITY_DN5561_c0_g1_i1:147-512(-)